MSVLYEKRVLNATKKDQLLSTKDARECRRKFLDFLLNKGTTAKCPFQEFLNALSKSGQKELRDDLDDTSDSESKLEKEKERLEQQIKIRKFNHELVTRLNIQDEILARFISEDIINEEDQSLIKCEVSPYGKAAKFLSILHCKPPRAFRLLLEYLTKDVELADLAKKIGNARLTAEDWSDRYGEYYNFDQIMSVNQ